MKPENFARCALSSARRSWTELGTHRSVGFLPEALAQQQRPFVKEGKLLELHRRDARHGAFEAAMPVSLPALAVPACHPSGS